MHELPNFTFTRKYPFGLFSRTGIFLKGDKVTIKYWRDLYVGGRSIRDLSFVGCSDSGCRIERIYKDDRGVERVDVSYPIHEMIEDRGEISIKCSDIIDIDLPGSMMDEVLEHLIKSTFGRQNGYR